MGKFPLYDKYLQETLRAKGEKKRVKGEKKRVKGEKKRVKSTG